MDIKRCMLSAAAVSPLFLLTGAARVDRIIAVPDDMNPDICLSVEEVTYAPGQESQSHKHNATIIAYVVNGAVESKVDDEPARTYRRGEHWVEKPGAQHKISRNVSATGAATFLAIILAHKGSKEAKACGY